MFAGSFMDVLSRLVRLASVVAVCFIIAGLLGFLTDEVRNTSTVQATRIPDPSSGRVVTVAVDISQPDPPPAVEAVRDTQHTSAREFIDDVGDALMRPFTWIAGGASPPVQRLLYSALALFCYGFLLQMLADYMRRLADGSRRAARTEAEEKAAEERKRTGSYVSPA
jgi:hypothetical protein